jgi:hypothetical protein
VPPVHFEQLSQQTTTAGQSDEIKRLTLQQEEMLKEFTTFKKQTEIKDKEMSVLQALMDEMHNKNDRLKIENESKLHDRSCDLLDRCYADAFRKSSKSIGILDLDNSLPPEKALKGTLVILKTMLASPLEFSGEVETIDLA